MGLPNNLCGDISNMTYIKQRVDLYKKSGNTFVFSESFTDFYDLQINRGLAEKQDTFNLKILNANNKYNRSKLRFNVADRLKIFIWKNKASPDNTDLVMDGIILKPYLTRNDRGNIITISGKNLLEFLFSTPIFLSVRESSGITTPFIIEKIIDEINRINAHANTGFKINKTIGATGTISTLNSDGTAITKTFTDQQSYWKKANLLIEEFSSPTLTEDNVPHMAYIKVENDGTINFYWQPRTADVTGDLIEGVDPTQFKVRHKSDVVNAVIANCGIGPDNRGFTVFVPNYTSINKHGAKWKYTGRWRNAGEEIMNFEKNTKGSSFTEDSWFPTSYPYTTAWESEKTDIKPPSVTKGTAVSVGSDAEYVIAVKREAKWRVDGFVRGGMSSTFDPKITISSELPHGPTTRSIGNFTPHTIPSYFITASNLRVIQISTSFWNSEITTEEDVPGGIV